jgi:hypothetical protein
MSEDDTTHDKLERPATNHAARGRSSPGPLLYDPIDIAAPKVGISEEALRARCRRAPLCPGSSAVVDLGAGIRAMKFGRTWRIRFPKDEKP